MIEQHFKLITILRAGGESAHVRRIEGGTQNHVDKAVPALRVLLLEHEVVPVGFSFGTSYDDISSVLSMPVGSIGPTRARCLASLRSSPELVRLEAAGGEKGWQP